MKYTIHMMEDEMYSIEEDISGGGQVATACTHELANRIVAMLDGSERRARRDMFAAAALTGYLSDPALNATFEEFSVAAQKMADAMISELDKEQYNG